MEQEIWKSIKGYEGIYEISNLSNTRSLKRKNRRWDINKKQVLFSNGYLMVGLTDKNKKLKQHLVHRLMAQTFLPNPENKPEVNHKNGIKNR